MKKMLIKFGFKTEKVEKNREIWTREIVSKSSGEKYFLSFCEFSYGTLFVIKHKNSLISLRHFGLSNTIKDISKYIRKTINYFGE